jgi:hypothetical protein
MTVVACLKFAFSGLSKCYRSFVNSEMLAVTCGLNPKKSIFLICIVNSVSAEKYNGVNCEHAVIMVAIRRRQNKFNILTTAESRSVSLVTHCL